MRGGKAKFFLLLSYSAHSHVAKMVKEKKIYSIKRYITLLC